MPSDYGYINARVRGLKAKLLGDDFYADALNASGFDAFMSSLGQSPYTREVEEAQSQHSGLRVVDTALARNFRHITRSILNFSDGAPERLITTFLLRYDLQNLKAIARAKHAGRDAEDVQAALIPAGELKPAVLENIASAADLPGAAQALAITGHPLSKAFTRAVGAYSSDGDLFELELSLDRAYYAALFDALDENPHSDGLRRYVQREVDAANIRTALKMQSAEAEADADKLYLSGGKEVSRSAFDTLLSGDKQPLSDTSFSEVAETDNLSEAEEVIRNSLDKSARKLYSSDPLGIGVVLYYLRLKEQETAKLRLVARGKYYNVPREALERELGREARR